MKSRINTLLPIALSIGLPALGLYSNSTGGGLLDRLGFFWSWLLLAVILYILWHLLWYMWELTSGFQKWWYLIIPIALISSVFAVLYLAMFKGIEGFRWFSLFRIILSMILFLAIQYALKAQESIAKLQLEKEQMQTENYKVQLKALRAQIDPHFLFNSLNTLRSMVRQQHGNAEQFVMSLSDFYRHTLKHNENITLPLSEELDVLKPYLFLMKNRYEKAVSIELNIDREFYSFHLPALALQVLVENCFKHNSMTSRQPLQIEISDTDDGYIVVSNNVQPKLGDQSNSGRGLDLLKKRYELMGVQAGVVIRQTPDRFTIQLKLV